MRSRLSATRTGTGVITYGRAPFCDGMTLLRGEAFTGHYRPHLHTTYVVGVVEGGSLCLRMAGRVHCLLPGTILLLNPHQVHEELSGEPPGWSFRYFFPTEQAFRVVQRPAPWFPEPMIQDDRLALQLVRIHDSWLTGVPGAHTGDAAFADALRFLSDRHAHSREPAPVSAVFRIRDRLISSAPRAPSVEALARAGGVSPSHLVHTFHRHIGLPPHAYFEQLRVARAKEMLHQRRALSEVACLAGYSDQCHFTRQFGATAGVSPGKYAAMVGVPGRPLPLPAPRPGPRSFLQDKKQAISEN